jgi:hypothetical protein
LPISSPRRGQGGTLRAYLDNFRQRSTPVPVAIVVTIARQLADALSFIHSRSILHHNLNPVDVLLKSPPGQGDMHVLVQDFGMIDLLANTDEAAAIDFTYTAPEILQNLTIDHRIDVYALGVILYELLTGTPPFVLNSYVDAQRIHAEEFRMAKPLSGLRPDVPGAFAAIVMQCLEPSPLERVASADALLQLLDDLDNLPDAPSALVTTGEYPQMPPADDDSIDEFADTSADMTYMLSDAEMPVAPTSDNLREADPDVNIESEASPQSESVHIEAMATFRADENTPPPAPGTERRPSPTGTQRMEQIDTQADLVADAQPPPHLPFVPSAEDFLVVAFGDGRRQRFKLFNERNVIGRSKRADITLAYDGVSRQHAAIERDAHGYAVSDLNTTNGTWVNSEQLAPHTRTYLRADDVIRIDDLLLTIEPGGKMGQTQPMPLDLGDPVAEQRSRYPIYTGQVDDRGDHQGAYPPQAPSDDLPIQMEAQLIPGVIEIVPGGSGHMILDIINLSARGTHFVISSPDMLSNWVTLPIHSIFVPANSSEHVSLDIHPPAQSSTRTGLHAFTIDVRSLNDTQAVVLVRGQIQISAFHRFEIGLEPYSIRSGENAALTIENQGNTSADYRVSLTPSDEYVRFDLPLTTPLDQLKVDAGGYIAVNFRPILRPRPWLSSRKEHGFYITVTELESGQSQQRSAELTPVASIAPSLLWILGLGALLFLGAMASLFVVREIGATSRDAGLTETRRADLTNEAQRQFDAMTQAAQTQIAFELTQAALVEETPEAEQESPTEVVIDYYTLINAGERDTTFLRLTSAFLESTDTRTRADYDAWWNSVSEVVLGEVRLISQQGNAAQVFAELTYIMTDGRIIADDLPYINLVRESASAPWLFDRKLSAP